MRGSSYPLLRPDEREFLPFDSEDELNEVRVGSEDDEIVLVILLYFGAVPRKARLLGNDNQTSERVGVKLCLRRKHKQAQHEQKNTHWLPPFERTTRSVESRR